MLRHLSFQVVTASGSEPPYYVTLKVKNAPYVHILEENRRLVSVGKWPRRFGGHDITVITIPKGTPILQVADYQPYRVEEKGGWYLFYYDTTRISDHVSLHILYIKDRDADPLDPLTIFEWSKKPPVNPVAIQDIIVSLEPQTSEPLFQPWMIILAGSWLVGVAGYFVLKRSGNSSKTSLESIEEEYQHFLRLKEANLISEEKFKLKEKEIEDKIARLEKEL
jgi:hypothetical protein